MRSKLIIIFFIDICKLYSQRVNDTLVLNNNLFLNNGKIRYINHVYDLEKGRMSYQPSGEFGITIQSEKDSVFKFPFDVEYIGKYNQSALFKKDSLRFLIDEYKLLQREFKKMDYIKANTPICILTKKNNYYIIYFNITTLSDGKKRKLTSKETMRFLIGL